MTDQNAPSRRWDPVVRITHWSIALAVLANAVLTEPGSGLHIWVGYGLAAILGLRLIWGVIGPPEARFAAFWPSPRKALCHLRDIRNGTLTHHRSHNPLGAVMVYAIWACLLTLIATGVAMAGPPNLAAAERAQGSILSAAQDQDDEVREDAREGGEDGPASDESQLGEIHETAANLLYVLILLHLAGVVFETRRSGQQVLMAMAPIRR